MIIYFLKTLCLPIIYPNKNRPNISIILYLPNIYPNIKRITKYI